MGLNQISNFPTRDQITLGIILTNRPNLVSKCAGILDKRVNERSLSGRVQILLTSAQLHVKAS